MFSTDVEALGLRGRIWTAWSGGAHSRVQPGRGPASQLRAGPAYVLVHGIGVSHRYLARLHAELAPSGPTYSLDLPGFGGTPKPERRLSASDYGAFIAAVLTSLGIDSYYLVGHSMGVQFAIETALHRPDPVHGLVLMGPVVDSRHKNVGRQSLALTIDGLFHESPSSNWIVFTDYLRCGIRWYLTELPVMMSYPTMERVAHLHVPVLVLRGERDPVAGSDWSRRLSRAAADGRLAEIPGCGHVVQHLQPKAVADAIKSFVSRATED